MLMPSYTCLCHLTLQVATEEARSHAPWHFIWVLRKCVEPESLSFQWSWVWIPEGWAFCPPGNHGGNAGDQPDLGEAEVTRNVMRWVNSIKNDRLNGRGTRKQVKPSNIGKVYNLVWYNFYQYFDIKNLICLTAPVEILFRDKSHNHPSVTH